MDTAPDTCRKLADDRYLVDGRELQLPMDIAELTLLVQLFAVRTRAARELLAPASLTPVELFPGTSALALMAVQYRDNPLGNYNEAVVSLPAYAPGARALPLLGGLDILRKRASHYVHAMLVDQIFTMHAGRCLWGYPKELAQITLEREASAARGSLSQNGEHVFSIEVPVGDSGRFRDRAHNLTHLHATLRRVEARFEGTGVGFRLGGRAPEIGERHPLALSLRRLGLPKRPLASASLANGKARFGIPEVLSQPVP